jgi:aryl-alcohol dehydrogenase-like predicted oxidoreductase
MLVDLPIQLAVLWVKDRRGITVPVIGPRSLGHLDEYLPVGDIRLSDDVRLMCEELDPPDGMVANFHNSAGWGPQRRTLGVVDGG